jgi:hypothetical protein
MTFHQVSWKPYRGKPSRPAAHGNLSPAKQTPYPELNALSPNLQSPTKQTPDPELNALSPNPRIRGSMGSMGTVTYLHLFKPQPYTDQQ